REDLDRRGRPRIAHGAGAAGGGGVATAAAFGRGDRGDGDPRHHGGGTARSIDVAGVGHERRRTGRSAQRHRGDAARHHRDLAGDQGGGRSLRRTGGDVDGRRDLPAGTRPGAGGRTG